MTTRQAQTILELRRRGLTYADIALHVGSSANTVKSHCLRNSETLQGLIAKEICKHCGAALTQRPKIKQRSFCSDRCRFAWWSAHRDLMRQKTAHRFQCQHCGCNFKARGNKKRKFCSLDCAYAHRRRKGDQYDA